MKYVGKKFVTLIITLLLISFLVFLTFDIIPGDAAMAQLGTEATPERLEALREEMGLNQRLHSCMEILECLINIKYLCSL